VTPEELGDALSWTRDTALIDHLDTALALWTEMAVDVRVDDEAVEALARLDERGRRRVLRAPEVTRRLLFASGWPDDAGRFVIDSVTVEMALAGTGPPPPAPRWSALGDVLVLPDRTTEWWPQLDGDGAMALDFGSPWARCIDLSGRRERTDVPRPRFTDEQVQSVHRRVAGATASLGKLSETVRRFVDRATCVLVLQIDPDSPYQIASGTNGRYIGRSFLTNPHLSEASLDCLAESVVHEAIHGLLYRDSLRRPWVRADAAQEVPRVQSPWTGRLLAVRPFLEAACVWFGLAHLWALSHRAGIFEANAVRSRLVRSIKGFGQGALVDRVQPWLADIRADIAETVDGIQRRVVDALADAP
jgi:hypothetical protein